KMRKPPAPPTPAPPPAPPGGVGAFFSGAVAPPGAPSAPAAARGGASRRRESPRDAVKAKRAVGAAAAPDMADEPAPLESPPEPSWEPGELLDYSRLRMGGPDDGARGKLAPAPVARQNPAPPGWSEAAVEEALLAPAGAAAAVSTLPPPA